MSEELRQKVIDKVRKLLALSKSANEHEAASAAAMAAKLLAEHNLDISETEQSADEKWDHDSDDLTDSRPWQRPIRNNVAKLYFCLYFSSFVKVMRPGTKNRYGYKRYDKHHFLGAAHNVIVAKLMCDYLIGTVDRLAKEGSVEFPVAERGRYVNAFRNACAYRLAQRIYNLYLEAKAGKMQGVDGKNLPVLASLYTLAEERQLVLWKKFDLKDGNDRASSSHVSGQVDGRLAGDDIALNDQIGSDLAKAMPLLGHS